MVIFCWIIYEVFFLFELLARLFFFGFFFTKASLSSTNFDPTRTFSNNKNKKENPFSLRFGSRSCLLSDKIIDFSLLLFFSLLFFLFGSGYICSGNS